MKRIMGWMHCLTMAALVVSGCQTQPARDPAITTIKAELAEGQRVAERTPATPPPAVTAALVPPLQLQLGAAPDSVQAKRFDVNVQAVPAREFFMGLVDGTPFNMVIHPDVDGTVSLALKNVTIPEVMATMRDVYGYEYQQTSAGFHVLPVRLQSRIFQVSYLNVKRTGNSEMRVSSGNISSNASGSESSTETNSEASVETLPSSQVTTVSTADFWIELRTALNAIVGSGAGRTVVVSPQSGIVVVRAMPAELREVEAFLTTTQASLHRQVILEAKIVEVELNEGYQQGINWAKVINHGMDTFTLGQTGGGTSLNSDDFTSGIRGNAGNLDPNAFSAVNTLTTAAFGGVFSLAVNAGSFTALIELLELQGNVQILSSPRVATVNNQKAVIKVGEDEFFVTDVSSTTVTGVGGASSTPEITLTPFFSGIALDVTPQIDRAGSVTLHIHPSVSEVLDQTKTVTIDGRPQVLPIAKSRIRESDSIVRARNGQVVVIGGLMQNLTTEELAETPGLSDAPFVGSLFRQTRQASLKSELVILLRPLVVDSPAVWGDAMATSAQRVERLERGFHYGGKPEVFGSEAEAGVTH